MNLDGKNLSLQFYDYLCNIVGSEEVVKTRRDIFIEKDIVANTTGVTSISSGSKAEGLDLKGSDYDQMVYATCYRVYESLNDVQYDSDNIPLVMDTSDIKPGFTKIKLVDKAYLAITMLSRWGETLGEETYISSKRYREENLRDGMIIHGPCQSTPGGEYDAAVCLRCKEWITPAQQWIHRSRTEWPNFTLVTSAVQYGVLFVPIGCTNSLYEDLQWRISFSMTEKLLIHSFSHTQLLCYALMKIILQDIIKPTHGDLLCSYFLKTIMFWLSEEINQSEWKPENIISCFVGCIRRLIYCVEYKICLNYFIPENNMFEDRFTYKAHKALLNTLRLIYGLPWISVFQTSTFQSYRLESINSHGMTLSASELPCYLYMVASIIPLSTHSAINRLVNVSLKSELCIYMLSVYTKDVLQSPHHCDMKAKNKSFYKQYKSIMSLFKISILSESISTWLLLASLFYKCKRFRECLVIINYNLSRCTPDLIHLNFSNTLVEQTVFKEMKHICGLLLAFKRLTINNVCFRHPFTLLPDELMSLIDVKNYFFPPVLYSYILQFLCCYQLGDNTGIHIALCGLELTIRERYFIFPSVKILKTVYQSLDIVRKLLLTVY